ncbi:MAG: glycosyltransferase [Ignavibacteriaceae bacterium]|nr:glycosyltransferase [Ignavibacteriaceae bacterium]
MSHAPNPSPSEGQDGNNQAKQGDKSSSGKSQFRKPFYHRRRYYQKFNREAVQKEKSAFKKLSVIIPLYNEEESLNPLTNELRKALKSIEISYEIIFVDDGSSDTSLKVIKEICRTDKRFKYISFQKNYGKSAALQVGFKEATGDVVVTMDADLQDDPSEISNLLKKLEEGFDIVSGWKKKRYDPFIKKFSSKFFNLVTRILSGIKIHDFNCGLKAYRKEVTENLKIYGELHRYIPVLAKWQGYRISETIVQHHPRKYGKTKFGISRFFKGFIDLLTVMFTTRYIRRPMHFFGFLGMLSFIIGMVVNGYLVYLWAIQDKYLSNRPMLFLGILLIIVGVQFFSVGLLGEMLVNNSRNEAEYVIKEKG